MGSRSTSIWGWKMVKGCGRRWICLEKMLYSSIWAGPRNSSVTEAGFEGSGVIGRRRTIPTQKGRIPSEFGTGHVISARLKRIPAEFGSAYVIPRLGRIPAK
ncbi:hypothetical protein L484_001907 [Morus notabilis]|uniref:Uncharacterized protein n=1 Tax=Morus notabilis TaxID=981085 RepID=W9R950_9ROSA|nr:hypothetical protein L484_001907 [Morus notabilis]